MFTFSSALNALTHWIPKFLEQLQREGPQKIVRIFQESTDTRNCKSRRDIIVNASWIFPLFEWRKAWLLPYFLSSSDFIRDLSVHIANQCHVPRFHECYRSQFHIHSMIRVILAILPCPSSFERPHHCYHRFPSSGKENLSPFRSSIMQFPSSLPSLLLHLWEGSRDLNEAHPPAVKVCIQLHLAGHVRRC